MSLRPWAVLPVCGLLAGCTAAPAPTPIPEPEPSIPASYVPLEPTPTPTTSVTPPPPVETIRADRALKCRRPTPAEAEVMGPNSWVLDAGGDWRIMSAMGEFGEPYSMVSNGERHNHAVLVSAGEPMPVRVLPVVLADGGAALELAEGCARQNRAR